MIPFVRFAYFVSLYAVGKKAYNSSSKIGQAAFHFIAYSQVILQLI